MTPQEIMKLSDEIKPILSRHEPALQGAVLADLVAFWLAGNIVTDGGPVDSAVATSGVRETLLEGFVKMVRRILPHADSMVREHLKNQGRSN